MIWRTDMPSDTSQQYIVQAQFYSGEDTTTLAILWLRDDLPEASPPEWNVLPGVRVLAWLDGVPEWKSS